MLAIPPGIYKFWGNYKTYIAQLELLVVLAAMVEIVHLVRRSKGLWLIDNIAALMALVRSKNDSPSLDLMAQFVQCKLRVACDTILRVRGIYSRSVGRD